MILQYNRSTSKYYALVLGIPLLALSGFLLRHTLLNLMHNLAPCPLYNYFNLLCPACGTTRSIGALLDGNIVLALHYNPVPYLVLIFALLAYIQLCLFIIGKQIQLLPKKLSFYLILIGMVFVFLIARNFIPALFPDVLLPKALFF